MKPLRLILALTLTLIGGVAFWADDVQPAFACSCMDMTDEQVVEEVDLVAEITLTRRHLLPGEYGETSYDATVHRVWKGEERPAIVFTTHEQTTACGLGRMPIGEKVRVWGHGADGSYSSSWCTLPRDADNAISLLVDEYGPPREVGPGPVVLPSVDQLLLPAVNLLPPPTAAALILLGVVLRGN